ncbi:hypothetical protein [Streptomyces sp. V4I2]|uniref:hypothetical protein n=1 Tax=Streptomyces sp. V4I2 TaxID=3042280 RepID=UPI0027821B28|nr:hypothetical protein [Streptomyces sp. V4I2]MDQ1044299.1 hypothetical protein [Streptomyces sp. V4I2]
MKRHAAAVVLVLTLAGCAPDPVDLTAEATPTATSSATTKAKPKASPSKAKPKKKTEAIPADLKKYLTENFTGTTWVDHIKAVDKNFDQDWVTTDLRANDPDATDAAKKICSAISGYQIQDGLDGFKGVRVAAATGERLSWRKDISASC